MTDSFDWIRNGTGLAPRVAWAFTADAGLVSMALATECGDVFAADESGGLYRLNRLGRVMAVSRGLREIRELCFSDTGEAGIAICGADEFCALDAHLNVVWSAAAPAKIQAATIDAWGHNVALGFDSSRNVILNVDRKKLAEFETVRPLHFLRFSVGRPLLVGVAEYGLLACHELDGSEVWNEKLWSTIGDVSICENARQIFLAAFAHGIQSFDRNGNSLASYVVEGTPAHLSVSHFGDRLVAATVENQLYWMDADGTLLWAAETPEPVVSVLCDPIGEWLIAGFRSGRILRLDWNTAL